MSGPLAVYGWRPMSRRALLVALVLATAVIVPMLVGLAVGLDGPLAAVAMLLVPAAWLLIVGLTVWRLALTIEVGPEALTWRGCLRRGTLPIASVVAVRPVPILAAGGVHVLVTVGAPGPWMLVSKGFTDLVDDLRRDGHDLDVRLSAAVGRADRMPGRNQYRRL
jgi:hypothetical protein